jgi:hypothetical protein
MIALLSLWRFMAWIGVSWRGLKAEREEGVGGWPDKSTAVGVGAGDWNNSIILAVAHSALLALKPVYPIISMQNAPSIKYSIANCGHYQ